MSLISDLLQKIRALYFFQKYPASKQLIKFFIVGVSNTALDFIIYAALTRIFHLYYLVSATISFIFSVTWSFNLNRRWTFKVKRRLVTQYATFFFVNAIVLLLNISILYVLVDCLGIYDLLAKVIASVILGIFNFTINKFWTFRPKYEKIA